MKRFILLFCFLIVSSTAFAGSSELCLDTFEGKTLGNASGITYAPGKDGQGVVLDAVTDAVSYPAESFAEQAGGIEFDFMLTQPLAPDHKSLALFTDVGAASAFLGAIVVYIPQGTKDLYYGIFDGGTFQWCNAKDFDWQPNRWYHIKLTYGTAGMALEIDGKQQQKNDYKRGLAVGSKKLGHYDGYVFAPSAVFDNFRTFRTDTDLLKLSIGSISPNGDGVTDKCSIKYGVQDNSTVTMDITDKNGKTACTVINGKELSAGVYDLIWDGSGLPDGQYNVNFKIKSGDSTNSLSEKIRIDRRWKWKKADWKQGEFFPLGAWFFWEDAIDPNKKALLTDMKAAGAYYEKTMKMLKDNGFNLVILACVPKTHHKVVLDAAQKYGIKVIVHTAAITGAMHDVDQKTQPDLYDTIVQDIKEVKDHPAVYGWYVYDEPPNNPALADRIALGKKILEAVDPKHPSFMCYYSDYDATLKKVDNTVLLVDVYALWENWDKDWSGYIGSVGHGAKVAENRPFWLITQSFGKKGTWKIPTPEEVTAQYWIALAENTKGLIHFLFQSSTGIQGEWLKGLLDMDLKPMDGRLAAVKKLHQDITALAPTLLKLKPASFAVPVKSESIYANAFVDDNGAKYIIAANKDTSRATIAAWTSGEAVDVLTGAKIGKALILEPGYGKLIKLQ